MDETLARQMITDYAESFSSFTRISEFEDLIAAAAEDFARQVKAVRKPSGLSPSAAAIADYIEDHIYESLSVAGIAAYMHFHPGTISRLFHSSSGVRLKSYIISRKLGYACRLLKYTRKSLPEISAALSFTDQSHFQKTFKGHFGITPNQYRIENRLLPFTT